MNTRTSHIATGSSQRVRFAPFVAAMIAMGIVGCVSNPYVSNVRPGYSTQASGGIQVATPATTGNLRIDQAIEYSDRLYEAYDAKISEEYTRQQVVSGGLLTASALIFGLAAGNAHRDAIVGTALGTGLGYQLGTWNSNKHRLDIYIEGMKAVSCAKAAISPLQIGDGERVRIREQATATMDAYVEAANSVGEVTTWLAVVGGTHADGQTSQLEKAAQAEVTDLATTLRDAKEALSRARGMDRRVEGAGDLLKAQLDNIRRLISSAINGTVSDLAQLPKFIASTKDYASIFSPGLDLGAALTNSVAAANKGFQPPVRSQSGSGLQSSTAKGDPINPVLQLAGALGRLRAAQLVLSANTSELNGAIDMPTLAQTKTALDGCGVEASKAATALRVSRTSITFQAGVSGTSSVAIFGIQPFSAGMMDLPAKGVTLSILPGTNVLNVSAGTDTEAGRTYQISVGDSTGLTVIVIVKIEGKHSTDVPAGPTNKTKATKAKNPHAMSCDGYQGRPAEDICLIQQVLKQPITGTFTSATCDSFQSKGFGALVNDQSIASIKEAVSLPRDAGADAVKSRLVALGVATCKGIALPKATVATTPVAAATCAAPNPAKTCPAEGARCAFECTLSKADVSVVRRKLGLTASPEKFDESMRAALGRFQATAKLNNQRGDYTEETAKALQDVPLK